MIDHRSGLCPLEVEAALVHHGACAFQRPGQHVYLGRVALQELADEVILENLADVCAHCVNSPRGLLGIGVGGLGVSHPHAVLARECFSCSQSDRFSYPNEFSTSW